jgi:hypothetical protein
MSTDLPSNPYEGEELSDEGQGLSRLSRLSPELGKTIDDELSVPLLMTEIHGPAFVLYAKDMISPSLVKLWANLMIFDSHCSPERRQEARRIAQAMELWQKDRGISP